MINRTEKRLIEWASRRKKKKIRGYSDGEATAEFVDWTEIIGVATTVSIIFLYIV